MDLPAYDRSSQKESAAEKRKTEEETVGKQILEWIAAGLFLFAVADVIKQDVCGRQIPDRAWMVLFFTGVFCCAFGWKPAGWGAGEPDFGGRILGLLIVSLPMTAWDMLFPASFGGGDVKLSAGGGFLLGWKSMLAGTAVAVLLSGVYIFWLLTVGKKTRKDEMALGPFLSLGLIAGFFWGEKICCWYIS